MDHLTEFRERGFTVFSPTDTTFLKAVDACAQSARDFLKPEYRHARGFTRENGTFNHILFPHKHVPDFRALMASVEARRILRELYGETPLYATHSKISYKFPNLEQVWLPHQDSGYKLRYCHGATIAVFLEDCGPEEGPIELFPGSHKAGKLPHHRVLRAGENNLQATLREVPSVAPVPVTGKKGDVLVFDIHTVHQSKPSQGRGSRGIFIFEAETFRYLTLESDGTLAMILNGARKPIQTVASLICLPYFRLLSHAKTMARILYKRLRMQT